MFERVAKQAYTGRDVKRWLDDIDFRSRHGKRLVLSHIYRTLQNPFYYELIQKPAIGLKAYAKYVLQNGTREEKREILQYVTGELFLKDQKVYVERKTRSKKFIPASSNPIAI